MIGSFDIGIKIESTYIHVMDATAESENTSEIQELGVEKNL